MGEGTGLGLFVVRDIVQAQHGGVFEISSEGKGKGSTFRIVIPKEAPVSQQDTDISLHGIKMN